MTYQNEAMDAIRREGGLLHQVARIIDPGGWEYRDGVVLHARKYDPPNAPRAAWYEKLGADAVATSLDKAGEIVAVCGLSGETADEYMSVTLNRDGTVTSHNAYDADFDEMVIATQRIVDELTRRLSDRKFCPYSHGGELRKGEVR